MLEKEKGENQGRENKGKAVLILCAFVIIVLLIMVIVLLLKNRNDTNINSNEVASSPKRNVIVNEENAEKVAEEIINQKTVAPGSYQVTMNSTWNFQDGASSSDNAYVENATANTNAVYFDVQLSDSEEIIYESPIIPVGSHLDDIKLDKDLDAGTYDCVLIYHLVDDEQNTLATLRMAIKVVVAN